MGHQNFDYGYGPLKLFGPGPKIILIRACRHHTIIHIINIKAIHCKNCGKKFKNEHAYKNHMRFKHEILLSNDKKIYNENIK